MAKELADVRKLLAESKRELLGRSNVVAVGVGYKTTAGKATKELALVCSVDIKKPKAKLAASDLVPASIQGVPTDVNPVGVIRALQDPTGRFRPAPGGVSIGHVNITAGTLGCLVKKNDKLYILSNNHVLANSNNASPGDPILQPGPYDGGQLAQDQIATLSEFVPIQFAGVGGADPCGLASGVAGFLNGLAAMVGSKTRLYSRRDIEADNLVDCAIAEPVNPNDVVNEILGIGTISGVADATLNMAVKKSGRTTGFTTGTIQQIDVTVQVNYGSNQIATFVDQLMAGAMSQGGDSGSAVLNDQNQLIGLLYAGSDTSTIFNRIQNVFSALQVTLP
ncbi:MAG: hypothetical protein KDI38_19150 [Calditrichaeota bacterium]|nr:hypothetical protein [Calditrichota bacterium]MCB9090116.1 hypothetical protein [Calditrichia bacterium]